MKNKGNSLIDYYQQDIRKVFELIDTTRLIAYFDKDFKGY